MSQKLTSSSLSRQDTLKTSHRRKNSITGSLILYQGRRSPGNFMEPRSPQGRRSPVFLTHDRIRSPCDYTSVNQFDAKSPTNDRKSPIVDRRSPTLSYTQERRSPVGGNDQGTDFPRRSPTVHVQDGHAYDQIMTPEDQNRSTMFGIQIKRTSIGLFTPIEFGDKCSPITSMPIPPITVSNPTETCQIIERMSEMNAIDVAPTDAMEQSKQVEKDKENVEKKEKTSVMKEILAFVRKPSKRVTTRTGRFAAAFSRTEFGTGPLIRQSTFSCSPAASSTSAKSAVTKQMSEVGFEPKVSLKFGLNSKMSLKLRRTVVDDKKKEKTSSENVMEPEPNEIKNQTDKLVGGINTVPFELANVHFEKVGDSYIKHEQIMEETIEDDSPIQIVALSKENAQNNKDTLINKESKDKDLISIEQESEELNESENLHQLKCVLEEQIPIKSEPIYANLVELKSETDDNISNTNNNMGVPTFEIEPPSRRSSFDPPRSPFLENLRSPGVDTDTELMNLNRLDSGGDSFEIVDVERNRESSFEDRYSSRDTSFDISRYQSTSYEDQTSSFEIIDIDGKIDEKKSNIDLRKSSIELVDVETFQRPTDGRKSSLETHFDYNPDGSASLKGFPLQMTKKHKSDVIRGRDIFISPFSAFSRARSPLSNQTSSNYSSRDSYDSSSSYPHSVSHHEPLKSPFGEHSRPHFPITTFKNIHSNDNNTDNVPFVYGNGGPSGAGNSGQHCPIASASASSSFERRSSSSTQPHYHYPHQNHHRQHTLLLGQCTSSGSEFEPPSPRRAASASPKHTFTFRIVLKKVDSSPDAICPSAERRSRDRIDRHKRRDSRKKRLLEGAGKSF